MPVALVNSCCSLIVACWAEWKQAPRAAEIGDHVINWLGTEAEDVVVTDARATYSDKVFHLSGVIQIKRKFIKVMIDCRCG